MIYTESMVNIAQRIADYYGAIYKQKYVAVLGVQEKTITATVTIKANETNGNISLVISNTKKVLITGVDKGKLDSYSLGNSNGNFVENSSGDIAFPFIVEEGNAINIYGKVNTAPSSDTDYTVTFKYIEIELNPIS